MNQSTPDVSFQDVELVVARDFPAAEHKEIHSLIRQVDVREKPRVILACLKNSGGDIARVKNELSNAAGYWREIILKSENPNYQKKMFRIDKLSEVEKQRLYEEDWSQYQQWLHSG